MMEAVRRRRLKRLSAAPRKLHLGGHKDAFRKERAKLLDKRCIVIEAMGRDILVVTALRAIEDVHDFVN
jgi:hypothetical protein